MKEKIKNFLLKIKNFFNEKHSFKTIELIIICILINLLTMTLSYYEIMSQDYCFNETHTEQVEETPQTERNIIDRDIKGANPTQSDYINPAHAYDTFYINASTNFYQLLSSLNYVSIAGTQGYPISLYMSTDQLYYNLFYVQYLNYTSYDVYRLVNVICVLENGVPVQYTDNFIILCEYYADSFLANNYYKPKYRQTAITTFGPYTIGSRNMELYNFVSSQPFETSTTPTLENAPSSLVNTLPTNALTTAPSGLGTLVYDTGSNFVGLPTGSNANILGVQIYYKSSWNQTTHSTYVTYEGINYYYNKPTPTITLSEVNLVIYTLWDDTTIYYNLGNVLDIPMTNYAVTSFEFFNWYNMLHSKVNVIEEYNDYWHLDFDIDYLVEYQNKVTGEYGTDISYTDYGFEMLIPHSVSLVDIGYKSFDMEKFIELDPNYNDAYIWIGEQTATNFVYQVFERLYDNAYEDGDSDGFARGFDLNGDAMENATNPILNFINKGASIISNVLNVEVLPNITLGTIFLFPLVIAMIWFVVKLFMGG